MEKIHIKRFIGKNLCEEIYKERLLCKDLWEKIYGGKIYGKWFMWKGLWEKIYENIYGKKSLKSDIIKDFLKKRLILTV